jgi:beta-lactamase class A
VLETQTLTTTLNRLCNAQPFETGWYVKDLRTGEEFDRRGDTVVPSGSTRKVAILMAALKAVHEGRLRLDQPVTIEARHQVPQHRSGCFEHFLPGFTIRLRDVMLMMIVVSDNACTNILVEMLGLDEINDFSRSIGMKGTRHREAYPPFGQLRDFDLQSANATTPADVGRLLDLIQRGAREPQAAEYLGCSAELCALALDILSWQRLRCHIPSLLPKGTRVANKTGGTARGENDAGVVFREGEPRFVLSVFTDNLPLETTDGIPGSAAASQLIGRIARECWDTLD